MAVHNYDVIDIKRGMSERSANVRSSVWIWVRG
jgi:hypothetical protein